MNCHTIYVEAKKYQKWDIALFGDLHIGNFGSQEEAIKGHVKWVGNRSNALWLDAGDKCEFITPTDKRFDSDSLAPWISACQVSKLPEVQAARYIKLMKPISSQCIGLLEGNHEYDVYKRYSTDIHWSICEKMGVTKLSFLSIIRIIFCGYGSERASVDICVTHGAGGGRTLGGAISRLNELARSWDADVYVMGHMHKKLNWKEPKGFMNKAGNMATKNRAFCSLASFFNTYCENRTSYGERGLFSMTSTGVTKLMITPFPTKTVDGKQVRCQPDIHISE